MLKCYNLSEADLTAVCSFQSILTRTGAVYRGLNSPHPNPSAENKLHIYRRIKRWNGTFPTTGLNTTGTKNDANMTAVAKRSHMVAPKVLSTSLFCSKCLGVLWFFVRKNYCDQAKGDGLESWRRFSGVVLPVKAPQSGSKILSNIGATCIWQVRKKTGVKELFAKKCHLW